MQSNSKTFDATTKLLSLDAVSLGGTRYNQVQSRAPALRWCAWTAWSRPRGTPSANAYGVVPGVRAKSACFSCMY